MASQNTSEQSHSVLEAFSNGRLVAANNMNYVPEPESDPGNSQIWKKQVLIPFSLENKKCCFLGPFALPEKVEKFNFFPSIESERILAFQNPIRTDFLNNIPHIFRTTPPPKKGLFIEWLNRVQRSKGKYWKQIGIFDLIQLSRFDLSYDPTLLISSFFFWDRTTHCFHLPYGMITPTLFDLAAITGLSPGGEVFLPSDFSIEKDLEPNWNKFTYSNFIQNNNKKSGKVSRTEHIAFLMIWLSAYVFCSRSLQVPKSLLNLAIALDQTDFKIDFSRFLLASLYDALNEAVVALRKPEPIKILSGPLWLLQLWLNAIFEDKFPSHEPKNANLSNSIEGFRLTFLTPQTWKKSPFQSFKDHFSSFYQIKKHKPSLSPFASRSRGPTWFTRKFPCETPGQQSKCIQYWSDCLTFDVLFFGFSMKNMKIYSYMPNLVARQFGLSQIVPTPMVSHIEDLYFGCLVEGVPKMNEHISFYGARKPVLTPCSFEPSFYCTISFRDWWVKYYSPMQVSLKTCLERMADPPEKEPATKKKDKGKAAKAPSTHEEESGEEKNPRKRKSKTASIPEQPKSKRPKATPTKSAASKATQRKDAGDSSQSSESTPQAHVDQLSESSFEPEQIPLNKKKKIPMKLNKGNEKQKENRKDKGDDEEEKETSSDEEAQTPPTKGTPRPVLLKKKKIGASQIDRMYYALRVKHIACMRKKLKKSLPVNVDVEPCDICGSAVWPELIATCSKCNIIREHCYCMRNNLTEIPNYWLCESCRSENEPTKEHKSLSQQQVGAVIPTKKAQTLDPQIEKPTEGACGALSARKSLAIVGLEKEDKQVSQRRVGAMICDKKFITYFRKTKLVKEAPSESLPIRRSLPVVGSGDILGVVAERNKSNIGKSNLQSIQKNLHRRDKYLPSSIPSWRGRFQILQATAFAEFYAEFEARSPCIVNTNAHNFSTAMPSVLQLESLPAMNVLTDVFGNDSPSLQDIAMYFFPSDNTERSRKKLNSVFNLMNAEKSMLRSYIDGVELLVFTSNHLNMDSRDFIDKVVNGDHFLWGVFRHNKVDKAIERLPDMEPVDMVNDIIGGKDAVERNDHVQKDKPKSLSDWSLEGTHLQSTSRKVEEKTLITSSHLKKPKFELSSDPFLWNSIKEYSEYLKKLDVPPGFKRHAEKYPGKTAVNEEKPI